MTIRRRFLCCRIVCAGGFITALIVAFSGPSFSGDPVYSWMERFDPDQAIINRIATPTGYERIGADGFGRWLRHLPLKAPGTPVYLYNGALKANQSAHHSVIDIDTGEKNLQQCADAVIRLRSEFLFAIGSYERIAFNFTSGDRIRFDKWAAGFRPVVKGNSVRFRKSAAPDSSYSNFRSYLDTIFMYAGSYSLEREMIKAHRKDMTIGDVFIQGGFPGHAVIIVDMAENRKTGKSVFLTAQSYMPAQQIHILKNPANDRLDPWYRSNFGETLITPEWKFSKNQLKRFSE